MNGAQSLIETLVASEVEVCFANPGTSEMHFVAALDVVRDMRGVLTLFEGTATGAADGYGRMAGKPAAVLLHLGPGLGNGLANLHNARRARTPVIVIVGDHATYHKRYDAPLESDIDAAAGTVSGWLRRCERAAEIGTDAAAAVAAALAPPGQVATLILPADVSWIAVPSGGGPAAPVRAPAPGKVGDDIIEAAAAVLRSRERCVLLLGGAATRETGLLAASRIAAATGARLLCETFPARLERGGGLPEVDRLAYLAEAATSQLDGAQHLLLAGARSPVSFFAYPGRPSDLVPPGCDVHQLGSAGDDAAGALEQLADMVAPGPARVPGPWERPQPPVLPVGELTGESIAQAVGALLPEGAIVCDEANTAGSWLPAATAGAPRHDWLTLTGGAIGLGLPLATGAAVACPDRSILCLQADGSAMYTISALWTHAREQLDITTVIFNNRSYDILNLELQRVGADAAGPRAKDLLDLSRPDLDFVALATGMGVPASRARTAQELGKQLGQALSEPGPHLIEAVIPAMF